MRGTIEGIVERTSRSGKRYWLVTIDSNRFYAWEPKYAKSFDSGQMVGYEWRDSGDYRSITSMEMVTDDGQEAEPNYPPMDPRDMRIVRMSCLRSAAEVLQGYGRDDSEVDETVLDMAREFERYILENGKDGDASGRSP